MSDDVNREALHDWLDQQRTLAADERPDPAEYDDRPAPPDDTDAMDLTPTNQKQSPTEEVDNGH